MDFVKLDRLYRQRLQAYKRAAAHVKMYIDEMVEDFANDHLFRVHLLKARVKQFDSLKQKAIDRGFEDEEEAIAAIQDIVGVRVVVNNKSDATRVLEGIKTLTSVCYDPKSVQDYLTSAQDSGYRALHLTVYISVEHKGVEHKIPCEVQIRTLLQDSWATLVHEDIYKNRRDLPSLVLTVSKNMADHLNVLDNMAQDIRNAISQEVQSAERPSNFPITKEGLAFMYHEETGLQLLDYEIQQWANALEEVDAQTLGDAATLIPSQDVQLRMKKLYNGIWGIPSAEQSQHPDAQLGVDFEASRGMMLYYGTKIMNDAALGYQEFRNALETEYDDATEGEDHDALEPPPETIHELVEQLAQGSTRSSDAILVLRHWGCLDECGLCGEDILDTEIVFEKFQDDCSNDKPEWPDTLNQLAWSLPIDTVDEYMSGFCHHCAYVLTSDHT